jgi:hypothetical protein
MPNYKITVEEVGGSIEVTTGYVGSVSGGTPGPAGPQGPQGIQGPTGPQGPAGSGGEGGGIDPDNVGYDIIAVLGQSNGQRWARGYDANLDYSDSRVDEWGALSNLSYYQQIRLATEPYQAVDTSGPVSGRTGTSLATTLARFYARTLPVNRKVLIVNCCVGSTSLVGGRWDPASGDLYTNAIAQVIAAYNSMPNAQLAFALWVQGEFDAYNDVKSPAYIAKQDALITGARTAWASIGGTNLPFIIQSMVTDWVADPSASLNPTYADVQEIHLSHMATPNRLSYTSFNLGVAGSNADIAGQPANEKIHCAAAQHRKNAENIFYVALPAALGNTPGSIAAPATPTITATPQSATTCLVVVTASARMGTRTLRYRLSPSGPYTTIELGAMDRYLVTGRTLGQTYDYEVMDHNKAGDSGWGTATATQTALPGKAALSNLTGTTNSISWTATATDATDYRHWYKTLAAGSYTEATGQTTQNVSVGSLSSGDYNVYSEGHNSDGYGTASDVATISVGALPTISNLRFGIPDWVNNRITVLYALSGGIISSVVFKDGSNATITPVSATPTKAVLPLNPTSAQTVTMEGANSPSVSWLAIPNPVHNADIPNATLSGSNIITIPNIGTNGTAFTVTTGSGLSAPTINTALISGRALIAHSTSQILKIAGVPLPLGAYHKFVITRHNDFSGFGNYISDYDAVAPTHAYWRDAFSEHVGGQRTYVSHNPPANNFGPAPASTNLAANLWCALGNSFDPGLGSNHSKQNVNGTLEYQTDLAERSATGTGINWNGYNDLATSGNNGYTMAIMIFGSALTAAQDAQLGTAYANDYGVTLG